MKSYDSRTYSINDFVEWDKAGQGSAPIYGHLT